MKLQPTRPLEEDLKDTALEIAVYCVGSTNVQSNLPGENFSDVEMQSYNNKIANRIYTYLYYNFKCAPDEDVRCFLEMVKLKYIMDFDRPELDKDMIEAVEDMKKLNGVKK